MAVAVVTRGPGVVSIAFSPKKPGRYQANRGFLAGRRNDGDLHSRLLQIEDAIGRIPLRKEHFILAQLYNSPTCPGIRQIGGNIKCRLAVFLHRRGPFSRFWRGKEHENTNTSIIKNICVARPS